MVHAHLEVQFETEDRLLHRLAYQFAGVMLSSGNMKKNSKAQDVVESIYAPILAEPTEEPVVKERQDLSKTQAIQFVTELENNIKGETVGS